MRLTKKIFSAGKTSDFERDFEESSSDDEKVWSKEVQKKYKMLKRKRQREKKENSDEEPEEENDAKKAKLYEIKETVQFNGSRLQIRKTNK